MVGFLIIEFIFTLSMFLKRKSLVEHPKRNQMATSQCPLGFVLGRRTNVRHGLLILLDLIR